MKKSLDFAIEDPSSPVKRKNGLPRNEFVQHVL